MKLSYENCDQTNHTSNNNLPIGILEPLSSLAPPPLPFPALPPRSIRNNMTRLIEI